MIDTAHVRIPSMTPFVPELRETARNLRWGIASSRPSRFYSCVVDLRKLRRDKLRGIDALLHFEFKFGEATHKIEIIDAGKKSLADMERIIASIFEVEPKNLELMRVDFTADVEGTPVSWFRESARFRFKRFASQIEKAEAKEEVEFVGMGNGAPQSLYAGRRPNCVRIYNKFDELRRQWLKLKRQIEQHNRRLNILNLPEQEYKAAIRITPDFEEFCLSEGFQYKEGSILTRVERQIGGDRFPQEMQTFGDLYRADRFNPFKDMRIAPSAAPIRTFESPPESAPIRDLLAAWGYQALIGHLGSEQQAYSFVSKRSNGNSKRIFESLQPLMAVQRPPVTKEEIVEIYQRSTKKQIDGQPTSDLYLPPIYEKATDNSRRGAEVLPPPGPDRWAETSGQSDTGAA